MGFKTKLDYSDNRQIKQHLETLTALSGGTSFGLTFADLTKGPDLATSGETESYSLVTSSFSGNATTTIYTWYDPRMSIGEPFLSALTPSNSAETQYVLGVFQPSASITIDGNVVKTAFTGVSFDITGTIMLDLGGGNYSGTVDTEFFDVLSAATAEYTGRTIWVDTSGITRTERLIVTNNPTVGYVLTCDDTEGMASWAPASIPPVGIDVFVTGGTYSSGTATFTNNTGGTFNVTGFSTGSTGGTSYWSAGTGSDSLSTLNGGNLAGGQYALAEGHFNQANGQASHAEGWGNIASGVYSHAEGNANVVSGGGAHVEGYQNNAGGTGSHAEGHQTKSIGNYSHSEGFATEAIAEISHAEGHETKSLGLFGSHSEGWKTIASGVSSHAEGVEGQANGYASHAEGVNTRANGYASHAGGTVTQANGNTSFASGYITQANGIASFVHGESSVANGNYTIVLGRNITGNTADTTYVDSLNIGNIPTGTPVNNLGFDVNGNIIVGTTGSGGSGYWSAGTGTNAIGVINHGGTASGDYGVTMGFQTTASGPMSLAQNSGTTASGTASYAEGSFTIAGGDGSHAEGGYTRSMGYHTHAEGYGTLATSEFTHAEGSGSIASGHTSHAEGSFTIAGGSDSHSQGFRTTASGAYSHAGGTFTQANGIASFVHGSGSTANGNYSIVLGRFITGTTADTTYVDNLNIKTVPSGPGTIDLGVNAGGFVVNQASDIRLKENINTIENALDVVMNLRGVTYNWKDRLNGGDDLRIGFIAQEVQQVLPELVTQNGEYLGVQYKDVPALLVEAIKELVNGNTEYSNTFLETQTIQAEDNNIELNFNGTLGSSVGGGVTILRGEKESTSLLIDADGNWVSNVNILSEGFIIPEYTPTSSQDTNGILGNIVQDDDYIYIKRNSGWKRTPKLEYF